MRLCVNVGLRLKHPLLPHVKTGEAINTVNVISKEVVFSLIRFFFFWFLSEWAFICFLCFAVVCVLKKQPSPPIHFSRELISFPSAQSEKLFSSDSWGVLSSTLMYSSISMWVFLCNLKSHPNPNASVYYREKIENLSVWYAGIFLHGVDIKQAGRY